MTMVERERSAVRSTTAIRDRRAEAKEAEEERGEMSDRLQVFSGRSHPALARAIANHLGTRLGGATVSEYKNGETRVVIEESVRGADVFIVQPTCHPVNHHLM